jgi:hypothetical protein
MNPKKIQPPSRGGKRPGAGRPSEGKGKYTVTLTIENVSRARRREDNLSGLLDGLLSDWLKKE